MLVDFRESESDVGEDEGAIGSDEYPYGRGYTQIRGGAYVYRACVLSIQAIERIQGEAKQATDLMWERGRW